MIQKHCWECGAALIEKPLEGEGIVPFCPVCGEYRFPMYNTAVSMIVTDEKTGRILLIQQYGRPSYILVAGYVNRGESAENAVRREILEETGLHAGRIRFNRTRFFEPSNTLMCNFTAFGFGRRPAPHQPRGGPVQLVLPRRRPAEYPPEQPRRRLPQRLSGRNRPVNSIN